jgi:hypothetical protein
MGHLGTVQNLLSAVGGAPHLSLPPFPIRSRYYHPPQDFTLEPLTRETVARFVRFEAPNPPTNLFKAAIQPDPVEFQTVGDLYGQILRALEGLAAEERFIGPVEGQDVADWSNRVEVHPTRTLDEARRAIELIVEEGEATTTAGPDSHYERFLSIQREYESEVERDPGFVPYLDVASNPTTLGPPAPGATYIGEPELREAAALFNAAYLTLLIALGQYYKFQEAPNVPFEGVDTPAELRTLCVGLMQGVLRPLGEHVLPDLPAGASGKRIAPPFETYGAPAVPWDRRVVWKILHERLAAEQGAAAAMQAIHPAMAGVAETLGVLAGTAQDLIG